MNRYIEKAIAQRQQLYWTDNPDNDYEMRLFSVSGMNENGTPRTKRVYRTGDITHAQVVDMTVIAAGGRLERDPRHTGGIGCALSLDPMGKENPWQPDWAACGAHKERKEER